MKKKKPQPSNHEYEVPPAYMDHGEAKRVLLCWEKFFLGLQNCEENIINKIKSLFFCLGKNIKTILFSQKLGMLDNGNTRVKYHNVFPLKVGIGVQW